MKHYPPLFLRRLLTSNNLRRKPSFFNDLLKFLVVLLFLNSYGITNVFAGGSYTYPNAIKFNYVSGNSYDAVALKNADGSTIDAPEWEYYQHNYPFAYSMQQNNINIQAKFFSVCNNIDLDITIEVISGTGIGEVSNFHYDNYAVGSYILIPLDVDLPSTIGKRTFTWRWTMYVTPNCAGYDPYTYTYTTTHTFYTLYNTPLEPETTPRTHILDYAMSWAGGNSTPYSIAEDLLENGFDAHYNWNYDCFYLSSDFIRLTRSLGILSYQNYWSRLPIRDVGDMETQLTRSIDPVGDIGDSPKTFGFHQWPQINAGTTTTQCDASTNYMMTGNWGDYEDYLYTWYKQKGSSSNYIWWTNHTGQSFECEAPEHRIYSDNPYVYDWDGPDF